MAGYKPWCKLRLQRRERPTPSCELPTSPAREELTKITSTTLHILQRRAYTRHCMTDFDDAEDLPEFDDWCHRRAKDIPHFQYWATVLELEMLVLVYVRSLRQASFVMYLAALTELVPWFHALDHTAYARWIPVHLRDMAVLPMKHPGVAREFGAGNFTERKTKNVFSSIPIDQAHEQNNALIKGDGGAVGLTDNPSALLRWMIAGPEVARAIEELGVGHQHWGRREDTRHRDQTPSVQTSFAKYVRSLVSLIEEISNPFEEESMDLIVLDTKGNCRSCCS